MAEASAAERTPRLEALNQALDGLLLGLDQRIQAIHTAAGRRYMAQNGEERNASVADFHTAYQEYRVDFQGVMRLMNSAADTVSKGSDEEKLIRRKKALAVSKDIELEKTAGGVFKSMSASLSMWLMSLSPRARTAIYYGVIAASLTRSVVVRTLVNPGGWMVATAQVVGGFVAGFAARTGLTRWDEARSGNVERRDRWIFNDKGVRKREAEYEEALDAYDENDPHARERIWKAMKHRSRAQLVKRLRIGMVGAATGWGTGIAVGAVADAWMPPRTASADATEPGTKGSCPKGEPLPDSISKPIELVPVDLARLMHTGGWFLVNVGTREHPVYDLYYLDKGTPKFASGLYRGIQGIKDLSLLGPKRFSVMDASQFSALGGTANAPQLPQSWLTGFYSMQDIIGGREPSPTYDADFMKRLRGVLETIAVKKGIDPEGRTLEALFMVTAEKGLTLEEMKLIREVIFDRVINARGQIAGSVVEDPCRPKLADVTMDGDDLISRFFALFHDAADEKQRFFMAHEIGHAIQVLTHAETVLNDLPVAERRAILEELKSFRQYLIQESRARPDEVFYNGRDTPTEMFADMVAQYLTNPEEFTARAPRTAAFIRQLINEHPLLSKLIALDGPKPVA